MKISYARITSLFFCGFVGCKVVRARWRRPKSGLFDAIQSWAQLLSWILCEPFELAANCGLLVNGYGSVRAECRCAISILDSVAMRMRECMPCVRMHMCEWHRKRCHSLKWSLNVWLFKQLANWSRWTVNIVNDNDWMHGSGARARANALIWKHLMKSNMHVCVCASVMCIYISSIGELRSALDWSLMPLHRNQIRSD